MEPATIQCWALGGSARPEDAVLLQKYGVKVDEITNKIIEIFKVVNNRIKDKKKAAGALVEFRQIQNKFKVTIEWVEPNKISCNYCGYMKTHRRNYSISRYDRELHKQQTLRIPDVMLHFLEKHQDLGCFSPYRIPPTESCKVFELGNTFLLEDDPLFFDAKFENLSKEQRDQQKIDEETLIQLKSSTQEIGKRLHDTIFKIENEKWNMYIKIPPKFMLDDRLELAYEMFFAYETCNQCHPPQKIEHSVGYIRDINTGKEFAISNYMIHNIFEHGYFGKDPKRIDPKLAVEVLGAKKEPIPQPTAEDSIMSDSDSI